MSAIPERPGSDSVKTTCSYCGVGCGITVARDRSGRLHLDGDPDHPVNRGMLCSKGQALHHVVQDRSDRLLHPRMRASRAHPLERVDWDTALDRAAAVFRANIARHGPGAVGFYVSGQCLTEEYYVVNKLVKGFIGCNNLDTNSRLCMSSAVAGYKLALGDDAFPLSYDDIEQCEAFLIAGANPAWCHPILFRRLEARKAAHPDTKIIVMDPRRTQTCSVADLHLQIQPGSDVAACNAIARVLIEQELVDRAFLRDHTEGFDAVREAAFAEPLATWARRCRVPVGQLRAAAEIIGTARTFQSWWAMGLNQSAMGVDKNLALINLSLLTGQIGKPGAGPFSLTGQPNAMGGREVGGMAHLLAAHHDLANPAHREKVARHWGSGPIDPAPGLTATEMFDALEAGTLRVLWIICTNPAVSLPDVLRADKALRKAPFIIVQDISERAETAAFADLLLPAAGWLEKEGTMTNSERRISRVRKLVEPPGEALPDVEILCRFAAKMGWAEAFAYPDEGAVFAEHAALTRGTNIDIGGLSHERIDRDGTVQWPCPDTSHPGTARLFESKRFHTPDGRARLHGVAFTHASECTTPEFPFVLTTGRIRDQWHTMTRTGKVRKLRQQQDRPFVEIHPRDAERLGLGDRSFAEVANGRGAVTAEVHVTDAVKPGVVFMPMHFGRAFHRSEGRTNVLTSPRVDPKSKEPDFKYAAVRLRPVEARPRRIVVVGAGAAAWHLVKCLREGGSRDRITVFGREPEPFYNRILLPDYVSGQRSWDGLVSCRDKELEDWGVRFERGVSIASIDRRHRQVLDGAGNAHAYDVLVLATGSSAVLPTDAPLQSGLVHVLRTRKDADAIRRLARHGRPCVIVGGGLLGIELAGALAARGAAVTLLHRSARLMGAQLDGTASRMLEDELRDRGIAVVLNDQVRHVKTDEGTVHLRTAAGRYMQAGLLVYAMGTRPNIELAEAAELACGAGVRVDDGLATEDPSICAVGEIAEYAGRRHGTTLAAREQAEVLAARLNGDPWRRYKGTVPLNILKVEGLALAAVGRTRIPPEQADDHEEVTLLDRHERTYLRCVIHRNRLVGALLVGDTSELARFQTLVAEGTELDGDRRSLLRPGAARPPVKGRLVCSCLQVGEGNIADAMDRGCRTVAALAEATCAGTGCGSCRPELAELLDRAQPAAEAV